MEESEKKKSKIAEFVEKHPRAVFWFRFFLFTLCAVVLPVLFIGFRFDIFNKQATFNLSGAGIIIIAIVAIFVVVVIRYVTIVAMIKHTFVAQCIKGFCGLIIPLLALLLILYNIRDNIDVFIQTIGCVTVCEAVAIPLNPLPAWVNEQQKDVELEKRKGTIDYLLNGLFSRKKDDK